jgi:hypothetical protein
MRLLVGACALSAVTALSAGLAAQGAAGTPQSQPPAAAAAQSGTVTVEGCLAREDEIPGRKPNIAERQGIMEDYILTSTKIVKGSAPKAADRPTGTAGTAPLTAMYHVKGLNDDRLKPLLGRRVQVEGTLQDLDKPAGGSTDLPDIQATTIRQVTGDCPAKP